MAWPYTAPDRIYSANMEVTSDNLNEIQERIVDLHRDRTIVLTEGFATWYAAGPSPSWIRLAGFYEQGYVSLVAATDLVFPVVVPIPTTGTNGAVIKSYSVKWYNNNASADKPNVVLYSTDGLYVADASAPSAMTSLSDMAAVADIGGNAWGKRTVSGLSLTTNAEGIAFLIVCTCTNVGDKVAGVEITYQPITAEP